MDETSIHHPMESRQQPPLLGFFLLPISMSSTRARFVSVSSEGTQGRWGNLDSSLSFLDQPVVIVGSSKGFLLCVTNEDDNMTYIICNPVTREFLILPQPHKPYTYVAIAFICNGDNVSLDGNHYEIVRAGVSNPYELYNTTLEIDTFSSITDEWTMSSVNSASPFSLVVANLPAIVVKDVIYWRARYFRVVAYDRTRHSVEVIELPVNQAQIPKCWTDKLSVSEGIIHYCINDMAHAHIKVWILAGPGSEWIMKHKVSFRKMFQMNPSVFPYSPAVISVQFLHPRDSKLLLLLLNHVPYWYNFKSKKLSKIDDTCTGHRSLLYEWPSDVFV